MIVAKFTPLAATTNLIHTLLSRTYQPGTTNRLPDEAAKRLNLAGLKNPEILKKGSFAFKTFVFVTENTDSGG
jgi:hypothetical protein